MAEEVITHSAEETTTWGRQFAARLKAPIVVLLTGELGSGKTTLTKGIVSGLGRGEGGGGYQSDIYFGARLRAVGASRR